MNISPLRKMSLALSIFFHPLMKVFRSFAWEGASEFSSVFAQGRIQWQPIIDSVNLTNTGLS